MCAPTMYWGFTPMGIAASACSCIAFAGARNNRVKTSIDPAPLGTKPRWIGLRTLNGE